MATAGFQIGWIPYFNLHPMHREFMRIAGNAVTLMTGHPTTVNRWLCDGIAGVAPSSSINLLRSSQIDMAIPYGIASEGPVQSVYIGLKREHQPFLELIRSRQLALREIFQTARALHGNDMRKCAQFAWSQIQESKFPDCTMLPQILFTPASAASAALAKILLRMWFGDNASRQVLVRPEERGTQCNFMTENQPLELVIGDEALTRRPEFSQIIDLGQAWWEITGLPFVFAVWQTSLAQVPNGLRVMLSEAASLSAARMRIEPQAYLPDRVPLDAAGSPIDLVGYWKTIQYKLTPRHLQGLLLYLSLYTIIYERTLENHSPMRLAKWAGQWEQHSSL